MQLHRHKPSRKRPARLGEAAGVCRFTLTHAGFKMSLMKICGILGVIYDVGLCGVIFVFDGKISL